ncbi:type II methionyl aminopeptidase [Candidatus Pacearchaeota archaeon]|nr:type II methionyl aminopeptidase [Candidatus Pacearchaeota archaeon]
MKSTGLVNKKSKGGDKINHKNNLEGFEKLKKAGEIAKQAKLYAREIIKTGMPLLEIAEKIEAKILELGGNMAFPVNLSINEIAAHSTPAFNDLEIARGLLKVDIGVHIDGFIADTAISLDLEDSEENKKLIESAQTALKKAVEKIHFGIKLREIGKEIEKTILSFGFQPVRNLSGHAITPYLLHSGINIPNHDNFQEYELEKGIYAIEPFSTPGVGQVINGKLSGIYVLEKDGSVRDPFAREILKFIKETYQTLPFCSRWLCKKFGSRALIALKRIEEANLVHHYAQLIEKERKKVAQAEHTIILTKNEKIVTT